HTFLVRVFYPRQTHSFPTRRSSDLTWRDPRGFSVKLYTSEGNYDLVGNNTPIFFLRDPIKFPDFIHSQKRRADNNMRDHDMQWRSEEHTSELQSRFDLVCRLLLEKK